VHHNFSEDSVAVGHAEDIFSFLVEGERLSNIGKGERMMLKWSMVK
jgi:hypothetical protein